MAAAKDGGREALLRAFRAFDTKGDGRISREEVRHVVARVGTKVGDVSTLIVSADTDGDGLIDYAEFVKSFEAAAKGAAERASSSEGESAKVEAEVSGVSAEGSKEGGPTEEPQGQQVLAKSGAPSHSAPPAAGDSDNTDTDPQTQTQAQT